MQLTKRLRVPVDFVLGGCFFCQHLHTWRAACGIKFDTGQQIIPKTTLYSFCSLLRLSNPLAPPQESLITHTFVSTCCGPGRQSIADTCEYQDVFITFQIHASLLSEKRDD